MLPVQLVIVEVRIDPQLGGLVPKRLRVEQTQSSLQDARIVGHNVKVELDVLGRQLEGWRPAQAIDTLRMARALRPGLPSYGLDRLGGSLGVREAAARLTGRGHHSAAYDATLAALVFVELLSALPTELRPAAVRDADLLNPGQGTLV